MLDVRSTTASAGVTGSAEETDEEVLRATGGDAAFFAADLALPRVGLLVWNDSVGWRESDLVLQG